MCCNFGILLLSLSSLRCLVEKGEDCVNRGIWLLGQVSLLGRFLQFARCTVYWAKT